MKRFILLFSLLFIFAITQNSFAQKKKLVDDMYGKDTSSAPVQSLADSHNFSVKEFVDGYLILPNNEFQYGQVRFNGNVAIFKDTVTQKVKRYGPRDIKGFVAGADTFRVFVDTVVLRPNPYYRNFYGDQIFINPLFNHELVYGNKLSLYKAVREYPNNNYGYGYGYGYRYRGDNGTISENALYLKRKNQWGYTYVPSNKRDFKKMMAWYLADVPDLVSEINNGHLTYDNIDEIVTRYNNAN